MGGGGDVTKGLENDTDCSRLDCGGAIEVTMGLLMGIGAHEIIGGGGPCNGKDDDTGSGSV